MGANPPFHLVYGMCKKVKQDMVWTSTSLRLKKRFCVICILEIGFLKILKYKYFSNNDLSLLSDSENLFLSLV